MTWSAEIEAGFGDLLAAVGEDVSWTDPYGVLRVASDATLPRALFKRPGTLIMSNMQISDEWSMEYRDADFPHIQSGDLVGITGMQFRFREVQQGDDPVLRTARLTRIDCS